MAATSVCSGGMPPQIAPRRSRISHSWGRSSAGGNSGGDHLAGRAGGPAPQQLVAVGLLQSRQARQDHVGVTGGLVEGVVERDHGVEPGQGGVEPAGVGRRDHRVAGRSPPAPLTWPGPGVSISSARHDSGNWPSASGAPRTPAVPAAEAPFRAPVLLGGGHGHRLGPHQPADRVEVGGEGADHVGQPRRQRAELLVAGADAGVPGGPVGRRELAGQRADRLGAGPAGGGHPLGREAGPRCAEPRPPPSSRPSKCPSRTRPSANSTLTTASCRRASVPGLIGSHWSACLTVPVRRGVDHHHLCPAPGPGRGAAGTSAWASRLPLAGVGVGPLHHHEVGALDVGRGDAPGLPVHEVADDVLGPLVYRSGRVDHRQPRRGP